jgi:hypothetical protein
MYYFLLRKTAATNLEDDSDTEIPLGENLENTTSCLAVFTRTIARNLLILSSVFSSIIIPILCFLLAIDITIRLRKSDFDNPWRTRSTYGRDTAYMSLDHRFDILWEDELAANNSIITIPQSAEDALQSDGSIGMFVLTSTVILFSTEYE